MNIFIRDKHLVIYLLNIKSVSWIKKQISEYEPIYKTHNPRAANLICDATFYGKRKDKMSIDNMTLC